MTFEVSCPAADSAWALSRPAPDRLRPIAWMPQRLEREKRIILEEILQLRDDPNFLGRLLLMQQLFAGHRLRPVALRRRQRHPQGHDRGAAGFWPAVS